MTVAVIVGSQTVAPTARTCRTARCGRSQPLFVYRGSRFCEIRISCARDVGRLETFLINNSPPWRTVRWVGGRREGGNAWCALHKEVKFSMFCFEIERGFSKAISLKRYATHVFVTRGTIGKCSEWTLKSYRYIKKYCSGQHEKMNSESISPHVPSNMRRISKF